MRARRQQTSCQARIPAAHSSDGRYGPKAVPSSSEASTSWFALIPRSLLVAARVPWDGLFDWASPFGNKKALSRAAAEGMRELIELLEDDDAVVRRQAAEALARMGPAAVPQLLSVLEDQNEDVRGGAVETVGRMGPAAAIAVPQLLKALQDEHASVRFRATQAIEALRKMGPGEVSLQLLKVLNDKDQLSRRHAAEILAKINPAALPWKSLIPPLARVDAAEPAHDILLRLALSHPQCSEDSMDPVVAAAVQEAIRFSEREDVLWLSVKALSAALKTSRPSTISQRRLVQQALVKVPITAVECKLHELLESEPAHDSGDPSEEDTGLPDFSEISLPLYISNSGSDNPVPDEAPLAQPGGHLPPKISSAKADSCEGSSECEEPVHRYGLQMAQNNVQAVSSEGSPSTCQSEGPEVSGHFFTMLFCREALDLKSLNPKTSSPKPF